MVLVIAVAEKLNEVNMNIWIIIFSIILLILAAYNYEKIGYKAWAKRCEINSMHPDWYPYCGINFLEKDPQWFIDNGYGRYVRKKLGGDKL